MKRSLDDMIKIAICKLKTYVGSMDCFNKGQCYFLLSVLIIIMMYEYNITGKSRKDMPSNRDYIGLKAMLLTKHLFQLTLSFVQNSSGVAPKILYSSDFFNKESPIRCKQFVCFSFFFSFSFWDAGDSRVYFINRSKHDKISAERNTEPNLCRDCTSRIGEGEINVGGRSMLTP